MKKLANYCPLILLFLFATPKVNAQSVDVVIRDNGKERQESIELPKSMTYPLDSLLNDWKAKNYIDLGKDCSTAEINPLFSDSVYIDRLSRMPTVMEMPYNEIVRKFIDQDDNLRILKNIRSHKSGEYCKDLIEKYYPYFPVWVFVELISFGDLLYFCSFYEKIYGVQIINNKLMNTVRDVRNAAAHSNCLLNKMTEKIDSTKQVNNEISSFIIGMKNISKTSRVNNLSYKFTNSFVTVLYVYDSLMNEIPKQKRYKEIQEFMNGRVVKNKQFFQSNSKIIGVYNFHKKVIDNLVK